MSGIVFYLFCIFHFFLFIYLLSTESQLTTIDNECFIPFTFQELLFVANKIRTKNMNKRTWHWYKIKKCNNKSKRVCDVEDYDYDNERFRIEIRAECRYTWVRTYVRGCKFIASQFLLRIWMVFRIKQRMFGCLPRNYRSCFCEKQNSSQLAYLCTAQQAFIAPGKITFSALT